MAYYYFLEPQIPEDAAYYQKLALQRCECVINWRRTTIHLLDDSSRVCLKHCRGSFMRESAAKEGDELTCNRSAEYLKPC